MDPEDDTNTAKTTALSSALQKTRARVARVPTFGLQGQPLTDPAWVIGLDSLPSTLPLDECGHNTLA